MLKVIALGNQLRGDDAIGPVVLKKLAEMQILPAENLYYVGSDAFGLMEHMLRTEPLLIIDCARMGRRPGDVIKFQIAETRMPWIEKAIALHGFSLSEIYQFACKIGSVPECEIIGIEPKSIEFNQNLSREVRNSIPAVLKMVKEEIDKYEEKDNHH